MIALNEILKNKEEFILKYKLMGKKCKLDKIIKLEKKFIEIDSRKNKNRSICNKLCSQVAEKINNNEATNQIINEINQLDKSINCDEKKSNKSMAIINKLLRKLPNPALENNTTDISIKTEFNTVFNTNKFIEEINNIVSINNIETPSRKLFDSLKNRVLKSETLPIGFALPNNKNTQEFVLLLDQDAKKQFDLLVSTLSQNSKNVTNRSIKTLDKYCSKEINATLCDNTSVSLKFVGEYISREIGLKHYNKDIDMTKFVNFIIITIKNHE